MAQGDITIRIKSGGVGNTKTGEPIINSETGKTNSQTASIPQANASNIAKLAVARSAISYVKNLVVDSAEYAINRNFQLTDDYIGKRNVSIAINMVNRVSQLGMSIATGFMIGGPVGAVVGGVGNVAIQGLGVFKAIDQQNIKLAQLDEQLGFTRERAGYSLTDGSVGRNM